MRLTKEQINGARAYLALGVMDDWWTSEASSALAALSAYERVVELADKWKAGCSDIDYYAGSLNPDADRREKNMTDELVRAVDGDT